ncbi:MAG TPA: HEPN domain-containing protein [Nitrospirae bacterium]|nr:HEPN domain-containing protein [Nitrospirota bacterium]
MTLTRDEKTALAEYRIQKAKSIYEDALFNLKSGRYATAVNRSYYAVLAAARALLVLRGVDPVTHSGCKTMLSLHFVKPGLLSKDMVEDFKILLAMRTDLDYGDFEEVDKQKAEDSLRRAERFLKRAGEVVRTLIAEM